MAPLSYQVHRRLEGWTGDAERHLLRRPGQAFHLDSRRAYRFRMTFVVRLVQVLLGLLAVLFAGVFVMALGSQNTGLVEKVVLLMVAALCVWGAFAVPRIATRLRVRHHVS